MKFNMMFPYFDISSTDKSRFSTYSNFYGLKKMFKSTTLPLTPPPDIGISALLQQEEESPCHLGMGVRSGF
jgi:hypothetical protein